MFNLSYQIINSTNIEKKKWVEKYNLNLLSCTSDFMMYFNGIPFIKNIYSYFYSINLLFYLNLLKIIQFDHKLTNLLHSQYTLLLFCEFADYATACYMTPIGYGEYMLFWKFWVFCYPTTLIRETSR